MAQRTFLPLPSPPAAQGETRFFPREVGQGLQVSPHAMGGDLEGGANSQKLKTNNADYATSS